MARLPNGCSRMLCALLQFGSLVSAGNRPSPAIARTRRNGPRTALSKRFSSDSSLTRSWPETMTSGAPIMSSQKIGPNSLASRARFCTGAVESSDNRFPPTGWAGGAGMGFGRLVAALAVVAPCLRVLRRHPYVTATPLSLEERALARVSKDGRLHHFLSSFEARRGRRDPRGGAPHHFNQNRVY